MKESLAGDNGRGGGRRPVVQEVDQNADSSARCTRASGQHRAQSKVDASAAGRERRKWPLTSSRFPGLGEAFQTVELQGASDVFLILERLKHERSDGTRG